MWIHMLYTFAILTKESSSGRSVEFSQYRQILYRMYVNTPQNWKLQRHSSLHQIRWVWKIDTVQRWHSWTGTGKAVSLHAADHFVVLFYIDTIFAETETAKWTSCSSMAERPRDAWYIRITFSIIRKNRKIAFLGHPVEVSGQYKCFIWKF